MSNQDRMQIIEKIKSGHTSYEIIKQFKFLTLGVISHLQHKLQNQRPITNTFVNTLITTEKADKIIAQKVQDGESKQQIAKEMGLPLGFIKASFARQDLMPLQLSIKTKRPRKNINNIQEQYFSKQQQEEIVNQLKECNFDYAKISREYNVPISQIKSWQRAIENGEQLKDGKDFEKQRSAELYKIGLNMLQKNFSIDQISKHLKISLEKAKTMFQDDLIFAEF